LADTVTEPVMVAPGAAAVIDPVGGVVSVDTKILRLLGADGGEAPWGAAAGCVPDDSTASVTRIVMSEKTALDRSPETIRVSTLSAEDLWFLGICLLPAFRQPGT